MGKAFETVLGSHLEDIDPEDLEMGLQVSLEEDPQLAQLWQENVENNNYMEVSYTEIMEHHDGAYLKATFRNEYENYTQERYVSVRSSGRVEITHALFITIGNVRGRVERRAKGGFTVFLKTL